MQAVHVVGIRQERKQQIHMCGSNVHDVLYSTGAGKNNSSYDKLCTTTRT